MRRSDSFNLDRFLAKTNSSLVTAQNELNVEDVSGDMNNWLTLVEIWRKDT